MKKIKEEIVDFRKKYDDLCVSYDLLHKHYSSIRKDYDKLFTNNKKLIYRNKKLVGDIKVLNNRVASFEYAQLIDDLKTKRK